MSQKPDAPALVGSTFPLALVRRRAIIEPASLDELREAVRTQGVASFWGHADTLAVASAILGVDVTPRVTRPALVLDEDGLPSLDGQSYDSCWVLSPEYTPGYRPGIAEEVSPMRIVAWRVLRIRWP
jgi:hypothetical protein